MGAKVCKYCGGFLGFDADKKFCNNNCEEEYKKYKWNLNNNNGHSLRTDNPHSVTKAQVGLSDVVNVDTTTTSNIIDSTDKRFVSDAQKAVLNTTSPAIAFS